MKRLGWEGKPLIPCIESISLFPLYHTNPNEDKREALIQIIPELAKCKNSIVLIKGQDIDLEKNRSIRIKQLLPNCNHKIIMLYANEKELLKRWKDKKWWNDSYTIETVKEGVKYQVEKLIILQKDFEIVVLDSSLQAKYNVIQLPGKNSIQETRMNCYLPNNTFSFSKMIKTRSTFSSGNGILPGFGLSPDLGGLPYVSYYLKPGRTNWSGIILIPVVEDIQSEGIIGLEIVSLGHQIISHSSLPLSHIQSFRPAYFHFPVIPNSGKGIFEFRIFVREARKAVHVLERRSLSFFPGLKRRSARLLSEMVFTTEDRIQKTSTPASEEKQALPEANINPSLIKQSETIPSIKEGIWYALDFPKTPEIFIERGVLSLRGWAWSRESGSGELFLEIKKPDYKEHHPITHRFCRFDLTQAVPEIPLANYAGFEISLDHSDLPPESSVTVIFKTPAQAFRMAPITVKAVHHDLVVTIENNSCDCCCSKDLTVVGKKDGLTIRRCNNCRLVFTSPRPDFEHIQLRYSEDYFEKEYLPLVHKTLEVQRQHWKNVLDLVDSFKRFSPFLFDVGTGAGYMLQEAVQRGWTPSGIDINLAAAKFARKMGFDVFNGDFLTLDLPENKFGAIIMDSTIEHFLSPRQALSKCAHALHPGGGITIGTISYEGDLMMTQGMDIDWVGPSEHLFYFSATSLIRLCESVDLRVEHLWRDPTGDSIGLLATKRIDR